VLNVYPHHLRIRFQQMEHKIAKFPDTVSDGAGAYPSLQEFGEV
jgi:hypothetical protein